MARIYFLRNPGKDRQETEKETKNKDKGRTHTNEFNQVEKKYRTEGKCGKKPAISSANSSFQRESMAHPILRLDFLSRGRTRTIGTDKEG